MASPDFTPYVNLTIYDSDAQTVYDTAVEYAKTSLPEFTPRVGTIENAILEASAYMTSNLIASINRLPDGLLTGLLSLMGFSRIEATPAGGVVQFELTISSGATISAGTVVSYDVFDVDGVLTQYFFATNEDLIIASGNTTGSVGVTAVDSQRYPDIVTPQALTLVSTTPYILSSTLTSLSTVGTDAETDPEYFDRAVTYLGSLSASLVTASQLTNYIGVNYPTVARYKVYDLTDPTDVLFTTPDAAGFVTIFMCDSAGDPISTAQKTIIQNDIDSKTIAGLDVSIEDMKTFDVVVAASVVCESNYSTASVATAVSLAIESYLSISGWDWSEIIDSRQLTTIASKVAGVKYVDSMDVSLDGVTTYAVDNLLNVDILEKGAIPIGACTTIATV